MVCSPYHDKILMEMCYQYFYKRKNNMESVSLLYLIVVVISDNDMEDLMLEMSRVMLPRFPPLLY